MQNRPVFLNLTKIKLPLPGVLSIFHRVSGVLLILTMPFLVWIFGLSLQSNESFEYTVKLLSDSILVKLAIVAVLWSITHHMLAGLRFLLIDAGAGVSKQTSVQSSVLILIVSTVALLALLAKAFL